MWKGASYMGFISKNNEFVESLFDKYSQEVYMVCFSYCRNKTDAEDCLQEVFCRAMSRIGEVIKHPTPEKWLFVAARLVSLERLRANKKTLRELNLSDFAASLQDENFEDKLFERQYSEIDILLLRNEILSTLNKKESELYMLRYVDYLDVETISRQLNISYSNTTTRLNRLKSKIIKTVKKLFCD